MTCANCGTDNRPERRYCRKCGQRLTLLCPDCGASNDPTDKFCGGCGRALDRADRQQGGGAGLLDRDPHERRFVVVLFADLVGFTEYSATRDPEIVRAALTSYFDRAREVVTRFGGVVEKFIGDAVMAVWGATVAHEDDAERAVRAGLELVDSVARLGEELDGGVFSVRVGVLSGEASVAAASPDQGFVVGDLVNTASRLQALAEPGTVVVGDVTYRLLRGGVQFEPLGEHTLKGKPDPIEVWRAVRVTSDRTQRTAGGGIEPAFVGRAEELRLLKDALHATERTGRSRLVSIVGEPGIGKTRLAWELRKYVGGLAGDIYWHDGRCPAYDQGLPLWALGEMVRQRAGIAETDDTLRSRTRLRTAVAEYVTSPTDREWIEPRLAALLGLDEAPADQQGEFFAAVRRFFHCIAERGSCVLVFEDFHWADAGLTEFVHELVERSPRHPILVLTLARPDLLDRVPGWGSGHRNCTSWHLGPLADAEMADLVRGMVQGIGEDVVEAVVGRANGIPLYAVELVRMLLADGDLVMAGSACCVPTRDLSAIRVPDTVRAVIEARLDRLPFDIRSLLQDAAVLGAAFTSSGLAAMSGVDVDRLHGLLDELVHRELLELESDPRSPERGQYRFVQAMIREVAYGRLTREERRVRHMRAAEFFAELGETELAGAVASHFMAAHRVTKDPHEAEALAADATAALTEAAERAARLHSHAQSLLMIEQALEFATDPAAKAALWQRAAESAGALAHHAEAIEYAYRALDWYRAHGDHMQVASAAALVAAELCNGLRALEAIEVLEPIVASAPELGEPAFVSAGAGLARAYLVSLRDEDAAQLADRVLGPAERFELVPTIVDTLVTRATALGNLGRMHEAIALLQAATVYAREHDLPFAEMRASNNLGHLLAFDDHAAAMEACRAGMEQANRLGDVRFIGSFTWAVAAYLDRDGRFGVAQEMRNEIRDRIELSESSRLWYSIADLTARVEQGDDAAVGPAFEALSTAADDANPQSRASVAAATARLNLLLGRFEDAYENVMSVPEKLRLPDHLALAMTAAAMLGDRDRLEVLAAELARSRARGRMVGALRDATSGALGALGDRPDEAVAGFSRALTFRWLRVDRANLQALFATVAGVDVPQAREASDAAAETYAETGAAGYRVMYAAGLPPASGRLAAGS